MRASSSSLRWPPDSTRAGSAFERRQRDEVEQRRAPSRPPPSPARRHGRAAGNSSRYARPPGRWPPVSTFSSTVISANGRGIWKVRPTPRAMRRFRASRDTSWPPILIVPDVGLRLPASRLNSVVLPAPLGPISPSISPAPSAIDMPSTARRPPNCLVRPRASISGTALAGARSNRSGRWRLAASGPGPEILIGDV